MVMRATEGEVVANVRRPSNIDWLYEGRWQTVVEGRPVAIMTEVAWPERDAQSTAQWISDVLRGEQPVPEVISAQVRAVAQSAREAIRIRPGL